MTVNSQESIFLVLNNEIWCKWVNFNHTETCEIITNEQKN